MTIIEFIVGVFIAAPLLWWVLERPLFAGPPAPRPHAPAPPARKFYCTGTAFSGRYIEGYRHTHKTVAEAHECITANYEAQQQAEAQPHLRTCPDCGRNHFLPQCPPYPSRVTDSRTGEVVGHWMPKAS